MAGRLALRQATSALSLTGTLPQSLTNGLSSWGTLEAQTYPHFLTNNPLPDGYPWGNRTVAGSHPQYDMPETCITRHYDFTLTRATFAPAGVAQEMIVVNGQFPGPIIEANWGDWIEVNVHNAIEGPEEGTAIHWHGLNQPGTPWFDGVPTVGLCPIVPGTNLTYRFRADEYGSSWYHSHFSSQYVDGALGPMIIYGPLHVEYDIDLGPILFQDWYNATYAELDALVAQPGVYRPKSVANLVNGKGYYPCANVTNGAPCGNAGLSEFEFQPGLTYRLRLVNTGAVSFETISIDNHTMTVIANDYTPVEPYETNFVTLGVGQRTDVLVTATGEPGESYFLRAWNSPQCADSNAPDGRAVIFYPGADTSVLPSSVGLPLPINRFCNNDPLPATVPVYQIPAVIDPDVTFVVNVTIRPNATGSALWVMNGVAFEGDYNEPILLDTIGGRTVYEPQRNVYNQGDNQTVRLIMYNGFLAAHPMHLHGHDFQVLAEGFGVWNGSITNPANPQRRDVQQIQAGANATNPAIGSNYIVLQWTQDNPGIWPFHCHIAWHSSAGFMIMIMERPDEIAKLTAPQSVLDTCTNWSTWEQTHVVDQLSDGLKKRDDADELQ